MSAILSEIELLKKLKHENIVGYNTVWKDKLTAAMLERIKSSSSDLTRRHSNRTNATSTGDKTDSGEEITGETTDNRSFDETEEETEASCSPSQKQRIHTSTSSIECLSDDANVSEEEDHEQSETFVLIRSFVVSK